MKSVRPTYLNPLKVAERDKIYTINLVTAQAENQQKIDLPRHRNIYRVVPAKTIFLPVL
jgi:hypothetical protein